MSTYTLGRERKWYRGSTTGLQGISQSQAPNWSNVLNPFARADRPALLNCPCEWPNGFKSAKLNFSLFPSGRAKLPRREARGRLENSMASFVAIVALGFFLGMRHATDPDHVIAVTTIVTRHRGSKQALLIGALWGVGHTLTILGVGGMIILLGWVIPARVGLSMEFTVGLMLILLGVMNLMGMLQWIQGNFANSHSPEARPPAPPHSHGDSTHGHALNGEEHSHDLGHTPLNWLDRHLGGLGFYQVARPLVVGLVHGLAGSAAVALLVLTTIRDPRWAAAYLLIFGLGTIAGMMLITTAISVPLSYANRFSRRLDWSMRVASGVISLGFGFYVAYQTGYVAGLFADHPQWTPH